MPCYRRQDIDDLYQWVRDYVGVAQPRGRALEWSGRQQIRTVIVLKILGQSAWEPIGVRLWEYALHHPCWVKPVAAVDPAIKLGAIGSLTWLAGD